VPWDERTPEAWQETLAERMEEWSQIVGPPDGGAVLDCSCGWSRKAEASLAFEVTLRCNTEDQKSPPDQR